MPPIEEDPGRALIDHYDREARDCRELWAPTLRIAGRRLSGRWRSARPGAFSAVDAPAKMEELLVGAGYTIVRSWEEELADRFDANRLLRLRTSLGSSRPRFDSLAPAAREACLDSARRRMECLTADDFIARGKVIYSIAGGFRSSGDPSTSLQKQSLTDDVSSLC